MTMTTSQLEQVVRTLRHQLCYHYYESTIAPKVRDQNDHRSQAFAYAMSLRHLQSALGAPLPRTSCQAPRQTTLNPSAVMVTRQWLETSADLILGAARHLTPPNGLPYSPKGVGTDDFGQPVVTATCPACGHVSKAKDSKAATELYGQHFTERAKMEAAA